MAKKTVRIAIIEDNEDLREELLFFFHAQGHAAWAAGSAEDFWKQLHIKPVDIVLVDIGLPGEDGFSVVHFLHKIGHYGTIIVSARDGRQDHMRGLNLGADLYFIKPVNFADLHEAILKLWKRLNAKDISKPLNEQKTQPWDLSDRVLKSPQGESLNLSPQEQLLVSFLLKHRNSVCSKERLHDELFGYQSEPDTHRIDVIASRLRNKARQHRFHLPVRALFGKGLTFVDKDHDDPV